QAIVAEGTEVAEQEGRAAQYRAFRALIPAGGEHRIRATQGKELPVKPVHVRVPLPVGEVELALGESGRVRRIGKVRALQGRELLEELAPPFAHRGRELPLVVGEVEEGRLGGELLPHEEK